MPRIIDLATVWCYLVVGASIFSGKPALCATQPTALTSTGTVAYGLVEEGNHVWRGIPYAKTTGGENR
jgi:hypothetical protein